jgi:hypothetical protein
MVQGEISPPVINEVSCEHEMKVEVEMLNGEDSHEINLELDKSHQEEDDDSSKKKKRMTVNRSRRVRMKQTKNMMMKTQGGRAIDIIQYNINRIQNEVFVFYPKVRV